MYLITENIILVRRQINGLNEGRREVVDEAFP